MKGVVLCLATDRHPLAGATNTNDILIEKFRLRKSGLIQPDLPESMPVSVAVSMAKLVVGELSKRQDRRFCLRQISARKIAKGKRVFRELRKLLQQSASLLRHNLIERRICGMKTFAFHAVGPNDLMPFQHDMHIRHAA